MFKNWFKKKESDEVESDRLDEKLSQRDLLQQEAEQTAETLAEGSISETVETTADEIVNIDAEKKSTETTKGFFESSEKTPVGDDFVEDVVEQQSGFFKKLFNGLDKTRQNITDKIDRLVNNYGEIDEDLFEELEEILITADIGMATTMQLIDDLRQTLIERKINDAAQVKDTLKDVLANYLTERDNTSIVPSIPTVILVIGVNGAGKTTSIGKIGNLLRSEGKQVLLAAADTFRAAAIDQLKVWSERAQLPVIAHTEGSDPAAVVFDACQAAKARGSDVLIVDTAGRLHNKVNLMNELNKIFRVIDREFEHAHKEVLLVLDATTGQNALQQAKLFKETAPISGLILTKLDGTAKGGFVFAIKGELGIPVKLVGVGEKIDDLQHFNPTDFANALMQ